MEGMTKGDECRAQKPGNSLGEGRVRPRTAGWSASPSPWWKGVFVGASRCAADHRRRRKSLLDLGGERRREGGRDGVSGGIVVGVITRVTSPDAQNARVRRNKRRQAFATNTMCSALPTTTMQTPRPRAEVIFSSDVKNMDEWARRTRIPLTTAEALGATYARAHRWLQALRMQLVREHNWTDIPHDHRMLFSLETTSIWRSSIGLPAGPTLKLQLPVHASSFFSPERRVQWQMVFHSDIFESVRKLCPPVNDILSLIQCLLTGVVTIVFEEHLPQGIYRTTRGLPSISWINDNEAALTEIFGVSHFRALRRACSDTATAYKLEVIPYSH